MMLKNPQLPVVSDYPGDEDQIEGPLPSDRDRRKGFVGLAFRVIGTG